MGYISGMNRAQVLLFPEIVDDYMAENNPVRCIDAYVASLDLAALGFTHAVPKDTGRPAYAPAALLKLYISGYLDKLRSSRKLYHFSMSLKHERLGQNRGTRSGSESWPANSA
jgi:transposase